MVCKYSWEVEAINLHLHVGAMQAFDINHYKIWNNHVDKRRKDLSKETLISLWSLHLWPLLDKSMLTTGQVQQLIMSYTIKDVILDPLDAILTILVLWQKNH